MSFVAQGCASKRPPVAMCHEGIPQGLRTQEHMALATLAITKVARRKGEKQRLEVARHEWPFGQKYTYEIINYSGDPAVDDICSKLNLIGKQPS